MTDDKVYNPADGQRFYAEGDPIAQDAHHAVEIEALKLELADALVSREQLLNKLFEAETELADEKEFIRDGFAIAAVEALHMKAVGDLTAGTRTVGDKRLGEIAREAYRFADAMMAARSE